MSTAKPQEIVEKALELELRAGDVVADEVRRTTEIRRLMQVFGSSGKA